MINSSVIQISHLCWLKEQDELQKGIDLSNCVRSEKTNKHVFLTNEMNENYFNNHRYDLLCSTQQGHFAIRPHHLYVCLFAVYIEC